jgi:penicillin-binding protein 1C
VASAIILDILQDATARIPGFGVSTPFDFPFPAAVKTGTSRHFTDNWAVATTGGFTVAVWAGNFSGRPMEGVSGVSGAGPLLHRVVMATARRLSPGRLTNPADVGATQVRVCRLSGLRATSTCTQMAEWFAPGTAPTRTDDWEQIGRVTLPDQYAAWARTGLRVEGDVPGSVALSDDAEGEVSRSSADAAPSSPMQVERQPPPPTRKVASVSGFRILSPLDGDHYSIPPGVDPKYSTIPLLTTAASGVRWSVDGREYSAERWTLAAGAHLIEAIAAGGKSARVRIVVEP